jgi:hypothetical protein
MAKKKVKKTEKQLISIIKHLWGYANPEGVLNDGCLGCGVYPEGDSNILAHEEDCDWVELRNEIEEMGIKSEY